MPSHKALDTVLLVLSILIILTVLASFTQLIIGGDVIETFRHITIKIISIIYFLTLVLILVILVLENSSPAHTLAWIMLFIIFPLGGFILYLFFGRNWRKIKLFNRKELFDNQVLDEIYSRYPQMSDALLKPGLEKKLYRLLKNNGKAILSIYNEIELFSDTNLAFEAILDGIRSAERHIHLIFFSVADDDTGNALKELLIEKALAKVEVRFVYDAVACWKLPKRFKRELKDAGVDFQPFMPVWVPWLNSRMNYRNHRKLVIVDGRVAFLGGLNIGDKYLGKDPAFGYWRDSLAVFRGDSLVCLQAIFMEDWYFVSKENLLTEDKIGNYLNAPKAKEIHQISPVQVVASGPDTNHASILQLYFYAIASAKKSICINTPYLILNEPLLMALKTAAISGVEIKIIVPSTPDHFVVFWGSRSYFQQLMELGVQIYEYTRGFMHAKILIVDDEVLGLGTANMDLRSFNHNFEITALIYDNKQVAEAKKAFDEDLSYSRQVVLEEFAKRSLLKRSIESLCRLFSPLL